MLRIFAETIPSGLIEGFLTTHAFGTYAPFLYFAGKVLMGGL